MIDLVLSDLLNHQSLLENRAHILCSVLNESSVKKSKPAICKIGCRVLVKVQRMYSTGPRCDSLLKKRVFEEKTLTDD